MESNTDEYAAVINPYHLNILKSATDNNGRTDEEKQMFLLHLGRIERMLQTSHPSPGVGN